MQYFLCHLNSSSCTLKIVYLIFINIKIIVLEIYIIHLRSEAHIDYVQFYVKLDHYLDSDNYWVSNHIKMVRPLITLTKISLSK